jgi:hypothetical protein
LALATAVELAGDDVCAATELIAETHTSATSTIENATIVFPRMNLTAFDIGSFFTSAAKKLIYLAIFIVLFFVPSSLKYYRLRHKVAVHNMQNFADDQKTLMPH